MTPHIVVVDDERSIRDTLALILEAEGYAVRTAGSAERWPSGTR